jgi:hypothetical protein
MRKLKVIVFFIPHFETLSRVSSNQSLQLTAGRRDAQLEFMKHTVDVTKLAPASGS